MRQQQVSRDLKPLCLLLSQTDGVQPHETAIGSAGKDRIDSQFHLPQVCIQTFKRAASSALELSRWMRQVTAVHRLDAKRTLCFKAKNSYRDTDEYVAVLNSPADNRNELTRQGKALIWNIAIEFTAVQFLPACMLLRQSPDAPVTSEVQCFFGALMMYNYWMRLTFL